MAQQKVLDEDTAKEIFNRFDTGGDGSVSIHELRDGLKGLGQNVCGEKLAEIFVSMDTDGSKCLSFDEFKDICKTSREKTVEELFDRYDTDGSGCLTPDEVRELVKNAGCFNDEQIAKMMGTADTNADGRISKPEFIEHMKNSLY